MFLQKGESCLQNFYNLKITSGSLWNSHTFTDERIKYQISAQNEHGKEGEKATSTATAEKCFRKGQFYFTLRMDKMMVLSQILRAAPNLWLEWLISLSHPPFILLRMGLPGSVCQASSEPDPSRCRWAACGPSWDVPRSGRHWDSDGAFGWGEEVQCLEQRKGNVPVAQWVQQLWWSPEIPLKAEIQIDLNPPMPQSHQIPNMSQFTRGSSGVAWATFTSWCGEESVWLSLESHICTEESHCRWCARTGHWEWGNGLQVRKEVPGTASQGAGKWENSGAQAGIMPCWQSSLECWGMEKQRMILARLQHLLEVVCMCEGWITEALAGGGIKRSFSVV